MSYNDVMVSLLLTILPVLALLAVSGIRFLTAKLQAETARIENQIARKALDDALYEAEAVAIDAVKATNQMLVDDIKAKADDGKLTKDEALEAANMAKEYFISHITSDSKRILEAALGPIEGWLGGFIEAKVGDVKSAKATVLRDAGPLSSGANG